MSGTAVKGLCWGGFRMVNIKHMKGVYLAAVRLSVRACVPD